MNALPKTSLASFAARVGEEFSRGFSDYLHTNSLSIHPCALDRIEKKLPQIAFNRGRSFAQRISKKITDFTDGKYQPTNMDLAEEFIDLCNRFCLGNSRYLIDGLDETLEFDVRHGNTECEKFVCLANRKFGLGIQRPQKSTQKEREEYRERIAAYAKKVNGKMTAAELLRLVEENYASRVAANN